jgi:flavin-dependent dehydrogenase
MPHADNKLDAVIVGAGPAGSWAAIELARASRRVLLLDKAVFPRPKVCGGCLSGSASARLRKLAGESEIPGENVARISFNVGGYRLEVAPGGATRMASRALLDQWLVEQAQKAGADVRFGEAATLMLGQRGWAVSVGDQRLEPAHVLIACGLGRVPRELGIVNRSRKSRMVAQQWIEPLRSGLPVCGEIELHWLRGGYVGLASPGEECVVALAAEREAVNGRGPLEGLRRLNTRHPLWERLPPGSARAHESKGAADFPWFPDRLGDRNALLIGDAAGYAEPFSGTGMAQAMFSAECAARAIIEGSAVLDKYTRSMRRHRWGMRQTLALSALLRTRLLRAVLAHRCSAVEPWLARWVERVHVRESL